MSNKSNSAKTAALFAGSALAIGGLAGLAAAKGNTSAEATESREVALVSSEAPVEKKSDLTDLPNGKALPVRDYQLSAGWGNSTGPHAGRRHAGIDFAAKTNEPVFATEAGKVVMAEFYFGYGNLVKIRHDDGRYTLYAHLNKMNVKKGEKVSAGQRIGGIGNTGNSTGPHLHFEVRSKKDEAINPNQYLDASSKELRRLERVLSEK